MNIFNNGSGNLLVDYVLPSESLDINDSGVFWPESNDPQFDLVGDFPFPSSDHRLVYADVRTSNDMQTNNQTTNNQDRKNVKGVKFLGEVTFPTGLEVDGTEFGGISGLAYDADKGVYYGLSDDRSQRNPARFYNLSIDLSDGSLNDGDITFDGVTTLLDEDGNPFAEASLDPEGIALSKNGNLFISSEGDANQLINPFVNEFSLQGKQLSELPVPEKFLPTADQSSGIRNNAAFESLAISPDGNFLYTAVEDALFQDGPRADLEQGALVRIIKYDLQTKEPVGEFVYELDPVAEAPLLPDAFKVNGLVELLALDNNGTLLALERSFSVGKGNTVKLYEVKTQGALDVSSENSLFNESENQSFEIDPAVEKRLLVDFKDLGITPDNLEGLALGPTLPDGSQSLIVASDNNFNDTQKTQFIALGLDLNTTPTVLPTVETPNTINDETSEGVLKGDSDDPAIWVNPNNPEESIVIGTLKDGGLATFNLKGEIQQTIPGEISPSGNFGLEKPSDSYKARFNNVDIIYNFPFASMITGYEPKIDIAIASDRANDSLAIFTISENGELNKLPTPELDDPAFSIFGVDDGEATAYGLATYTSPTSGKSYVFVTQADGNKVAQIELTSKLGPADEPLMEAKVVRTLELPIPEDGTAEDGQAEGLVVDKELGFLYVAMEDGAGILKFGAEPQSSNDFTVVQGSQSKEDLQQVPFSDFITFGDSLADVGNVFLITQGTEPPSPPYFNGRFSNGELVPEILAKELGLSASTPSLAGGNNYAFGSAEAGSGNSDEGFPNVGEQINSYLATDTPEATDVFFISAGSNNFFPDTNVEATAENIPTPESVLEGLTDNITTLANAGAENFIIPNLAPLGTLPSSNAAGISDQLNALSAQFNTLLDIELDELEDELGINITELDVAGEITTIQANPSKFGFTNINEPALNTTTGAVVPNPDEYFWWDAVHPTGTAYNLVAQGLIDDLPKGTTQFTDTSTSPLVPDVEGLSIYYGKDGTGYLIASSQG
ncbi:MAG: phytase, partial [Mastigocoleus sp. MO_167.B18]|nr:phytase [Mastigocoleus sp. MO_167.B18]